MIEAIVTVMGSTLLLVIGWAFTLSNRVSVLEADKTSMRELIDAKLDNITMRLARIEAKLDRE